LFQENNILPWVLLGAAIANAFSLLCLNWLISTWRVRQKSNTSGLTQGSCVTAQVGKRAGRITTESFDNAFTLASCWEAAVSFKLAGPYVWKIKASTWAMDQWHRLLLPRENRVLVFAEARNENGWRAVFALRCATAQYHQTFCAVLSHSRALPTF